MPLELPYTIIETKRELKTYLRVRLDRPVDFDSLTVEDVEDLLFELQVRDYERQRNNAELALLNAVTPNKITKGSPGNVKETGYYSPDELISMLHGMPVKQTTMAKQIHQRMLDIGAIKPTAEERQEQLKRQQMAQGPKTILKPWKPQE